MLKILGDFHTLLYHMVVETDRISGVLLRRPVIQVSLFPQTAQWVPNLEVEWMSRKAIEWRLL